MTSINTQPPVIAGLDGHFPANARLFQLDGWRGISISCVLAAHLLPLGPGLWRLNANAGNMGMSLFFTLSGYLITSFLIYRPQVKPFLIRRLCRIIPLAWLFMIVTLVVFAGSPAAWASNVLFALNYSHDHLEPYNSHMWSLCMEMHFYFFVAALVAIAGRRGLYILPLLCLAVTGARIATGTTVSIVTHLRVDEILAGATLALWLTGFIPVTPRLLARVSPWLGLACLIAASNPHTGPLQYFRPYAGAIAIGTTLAQPTHALSRLLHNRVLEYLASISYALYVIHGPLRIGWLAGEGAFDRYLIKRPITLALSFGLAHLSTFYWESRWITIGRRLTAERDADSNSCSAEDAGATGPKPVTANGVEA